MNNFMAATLHERQPSVSLAHTISNRRYRNEPVIWPETARNSKEKYCRMPHEPIRKSRDRQHRVEAGRVDDQTKCLATREAIRPYFLLIKRAPEIPRGNGAIGTPFLAVAVQLGWRR